MKDTQSVRVDRTAPSVTTESGYYLQMKDDFGHTYSSPIFNIACERIPFFRWGNKGMRKHSVF